MGESGPFAHALVYVSLPVAFAAGLLAPATAPRAPLVAVGAAVVVLLAAWMTHGGGIDRVEVDLPDPLTYLLEVLGTFGVASVVTAPLARTPILSTGVVVVTPRTAALLTYTAVTLCWLYAFGGHRRLVAGVRIVRGRRRID